jgi:hypothetical protein
MTHGRPTHPVYDTVPLMTVGPTLSTNALASFDCGRVSRFKTRPQNLDTGIFDNMLVAILLVDYYIGANDK